MKAVKVKEGIYWVGGIDWSLRNFHGYMTQRGSTYNAYLIIDEKITLIDSVKEYLTDEMLKRISSIIDVSKIDYVISNHTEMDHSGALPKVMEIAKNATLFTSPNGEKGLKAHFRKDWNFKIVQSGESISLGKRSLQFVLTPMVHWPDSMVCYMPEEKILFPNDAFGQHLASSERFDDEYPVEIVLEEARKYYANIVLPYNKPVTKALEDLKGLEIDMIAPSHGIIWRKYISRIIEEYKSWSANKTNRRAVIIYDSMWGSTEKMAYAIAEAFDEKNYNYTIFNLQNNHISDIMTELIDAEYICVGSPTLNNNILPTVASFLTYMKGLAPKDRKGIAFGSYGWGGQSVGQVETYLKESGMEIIDTPRVKYIPSDEDLEKIKESIKSKIN